MDTTFSASLASLNSALAAVSVVKPATIDALALSGYLLVAKGDTCSIYSESSQQKARASFTIKGLSDGEVVSFVLPLKNAAPLSCLDGSITFTSSSLGEFHLSYTTDGGAIQRFSTFDPRTLQSLDSDLDSAKQVCTFNAAIFREMLGLAKPYLADQSNLGVKESMKNIQIYDESRPEWAGGDQFMVASTGRRVIHLRCGEFQGKALTIPGTRVPLVLAFLAKSSGYVSLSTSESSTYLTNSSNTVVGWSDSSAELSKFKYFGLDQDSHILLASKSDLLKALQYVRKSLDPKEDRARLVYSHETPLLKIFSSENGTETVSPPVFVKALSSVDSLEGGAKSEKDDFSCVVSIDWLIDLVSPLKVDEVTLRLAPLREGQYLIRTVESFNLDSSGKVMSLCDLAADEPDKETPCECQVLRAIASKA
jgi:hypothetical protein